MFKGNRQTRDTGKPIPLKTPLYKRQLILKKIVKEMTTPKGQGIFKGGRTSIVSRAVRPLKCAFSLPFSHKRGAWVQGCVTPCITSGFVGRQEGPSAGFGNVQRPTKRSFDRKELILWG